MTLSEIIKAVNFGLKVYFRSTEMVVKTDKDQCRYWIEHINGQSMPLECGQGYITWLNGDESEYFTND
jgi:hypothetical protein